MNFEINLVWDRSVLAVLAGFEVHCSVHSVKKNVRDKVVRRLCAAEGKKIRGNGSTVRLSTAGATIRLQVKKGMDYVDINP